MLHLCAAHTAGNLQFDREGCFPQTTPTNPYTHSLPMSAAWEGEGLKCRNNLCNIPKAAPSDLADWQKRLILKCKALLWVGRVCVGGGWWKQMRIQLWPRLDAKEHGLKMCHICLKSFWQPQPKGGLNHNISSYCYWQPIRSNLLVGSQFLM